MDFLKNLDNLLKINDMKRVDLARAIGVAPSTINSWFSRNSDNINITALKDIAAYFGVSLEVLINGDVTNTLCFIEGDYTKAELKLIESFANWLIESRGVHHD
jgi:transcriptional regulator with XRE-family HTH domain